MKKIFFSLVVITIALNNCFSQDTIVKKSGDTILAKVLEVSPSTIKYKAFNNLSGPFDSVSTTTLKRVVYENGLTQNFNESLKDSRNVFANSNSSQLFEKGQADASIYYKDLGPGGLTIATNIYPLPIIGGLITAAVCSSVTPREHNLNCPYPDLMRNPDYKNGYTQKAFQIKKT